MEDNLDLTKNEEINKALLEFQVDNTKEKLFDKSKDIKNLSDSKMVSFVMKIFHLKDEKYANYVLIIFIVLAILISLFLVFTKIISHKLDTVPQFREDIEPSVLKKLPPGVYQTLPSKYDKFK